MIQKELLPLMLLYGDGQSPITTLTRVQKGVFLLQEEYYDEDIEGDGYSFKPVETGPFSEELCAAIKAYADRGYIDSETVSTPGSGEDVRYTLSESGVAFLESCIRVDSFDSDMDAATTISKVVSRKPLLGVIKHVCLRHPQMATSCPHFPM